MLDHQAPGRGRSREKYNLTRGLLKSGSKPHRLVITVWIERSHIEDVPPEYVRPGDRKDRTMVVSSRPGHRLAPLAIVLLFGLAFRPHTPGQSAEDRQTPTATAAPCEEPTRFKPTPVLLPEVNSAVLALAYAPDGQTLAVAFDDQTVQLRALPGGEVRHTLKGHADAVACLAFSRDGKTLATGGADKVVKLWDTVSGNERRTLQGHTNWVYALAFAPDGKTLASGAYDKTIRLWDCANRRGARHPERPQSVDPRPGLLARRQAFGQRQQRPDHQALGPGAARRASHAYGEHRPRPCPGVRAGRQDAGQRRRRRQRAVVGCGHGARSGRRCGATATR